MPAISLQDGGHGCKDQYTAQPEMKVNGGHVHRKSLACTQAKLILPVRIFQSELLDRVF